MSRRLLFVLAGLLLLAGAVHLGTRWIESRPVEASLSIATRADPAAAFEERLRAETGRPLSPSVVAELGERAGVLLEERMDELATRIDPGAADWRPVFDRLAAEHPATEAEVLALYREELSRAEEFVREKRLVPLPREPLRVEAVENRMLRRVFPLALYVDPGRLGVILRPPRADAPTPSYLANHCRICVPPLAVHEGYPGHHVAYGLAREAGADRPSAPGGSRHRGNMAYQEGWAQYAEFLMLESGYWEDPSRELGALRLVALRALRAEVDGRMALGGLSPEEAERLYVERVRATPKAARAEVAGHLAEPGRKSAYLVGALQILALRDAVGLRVGDEDLRELHRRLLDRPAPIPILAARRFGVVLAEERLDADRLPLRSAVRGAG